MTASVTAEQVMATGVPLRINDELTIHLRFNFLALNAIEAKYGSSNPLDALVQPDSITDTLAYIVGAACLHKGNEIAGGLLQEIRQGQVTPAAAAQALSLQVMSEFDSVDGQPIHDALAKTADVALRMVACDGCEHAFGDHHWKDSCTADGCACRLYHPEPMPCSTCKHSVGEHGMTEPCGHKGCKCSGFALVGKEKAEQAAPATGQEPPTSLPDTTAPTGSS